MTDDELIETFLAAQAPFTERMHAVGEDQWPLGTPDAQWTVADLAGHLVDEHRWAGPLLDGLGMAAAGAAVAARWGPPGRRGNLLLSRRGGGGAPAGGGGRGRGGPARPG